MNAVTLRQNTALAVPNEADVIEVLRNSLYPGARPESVALVLAWCRATGRDPMKKPIHVVPMWVKDAATGQSGMRDVLIPGIGTYRSDAASTGQYAGKGEPEFGPEVTRKIDTMEVTFPLWCKVSVLRLIGGQERRFTAMEYWMENYAAGKEKKGVNDMWRKRPYGQLAKCAESQALRMAFPDETGNTNTAEEMEGKGFDGPTIDAQVEPVRLATAQRQRDAVDADSIPALLPPSSDVARDWTDEFVGILSRAPTLADLEGLVARPAKQRRVGDLSTKRPELFNEVVAAIDAARERLRPAPEPTPEPPAGDLDDEVPF